MRVLFCLNHSVNSFLNFHNRQRGEPEPCASTLDSRGNLVDIVADDTKPDVLGILFNNTAEGCLGCLGHHVRLIKDDEFIAFGEQGPCFRELLDLFAHDIDTTVIRRIELDVGVSV